MKSWVKKIAGFGIASFFSDVSHEMTVSLIPIIVAQFVQPSQVPFFLGIIASLTGAFASLLRLFSGYISDMISRKKPLITLGYAFSGIFSALTGFAHSLWQVLIYRMLSFTGSGLREPPRDALIAATIEPEYYGRAFGFKNAMDTAGSLVGPLIALALASTLSMRNIFLVSLIPGLLSVGAIIFLTKDIVLKRDTKSLQKRQLITNLKLLPKSFLVFLAILFLFDLSCFDKLLMLARTKEILTVDSNAIAQALILMYAFFNSSRAVSEFVFGLISDFVNRILLLAFFGCGLFAVTAAMFMPAHVTYTYCALIFILAGMSIAASTTLKKAYAADLLPAEIRGLGFGILQAAEGCAALISSTVIGLLWTIYSPLLAFSYVIVLSIVSAISLVAFWLWLHRININKS